jgi:hypothetical protein
MCVQHPRRRNRSEPSTSPCRSRDATCHPATCGGGLRLAAHVCAAPGASRSQRAEHVPVPLARRYMPPRHVRRGSVLGGPCVCRTRRVAITASRARPRAARATRHAPRHVRRGSAPGGPCVCRIHGVVIAASRARPRAARASRHATLPRTAGVRAEPHPRRRDPNHSEPRTSPCRSRDATCPPPRAAGVCAGRPMCVPHLARPSCDHS